MTKIEVSRLYKELFAQWKLDRNDDTTVAVYYVWGMLQYDQRQSLNYVMQLCEDDMRKQATRMGWLDRKG
jgi:N-acyl-L-homoserine lactone synthetase